MYNHGNQYRCSIIRGKSQKEIDDLLPAYANIIADICPCPKKSFEQSFNNRLSKYIPANSTKKTFDNHRTEIAGTFFGMYYAVSDTEGETMYPSERTLKFLEDNDQPAFFKDVCFKFQFPNGMTNLSTLIERRNLNISIRPYCYIIKMLETAKHANIILTKNDIGYYVLNNLDALKRQASPYEVIDQIIIDKMKGITRKVFEPGKATSFNIQHINEQINYIELANLVITRDNGEVLLNENERSVIDIFISHWNDDPEFNVYTYALDTVAQRKQFQYDWDVYFSKLSSFVSQFITTPESLGIPEVPGLVKRPGVNLVEFGDEGEAYVFGYEKRRVTAFDVRLGNKVLHLGKTKGLGYDIQSVIAEPGEMAEFVKYIEVKSTKRVTVPDLGDDLWVDTLNITRNEWIAAQQHKDFYLIYRVYFTRGQIVMFVIKNMYEKERENKVRVTPLMYRVDFGSKAIDAVIK